MAWQQHAGEFERFGYRLAALAVDPPARAVKVRRDLELTFPVLCDPGRETVQAWNLYNRRERGGIAVPATAVLGVDGRVQLFEREHMTQRLRASGVLRFVASGGAAPLRRGLWPGLRSWWRAFKH